MKGWIAVALALVPMLAGCTAAADFSSHDVDEWKERLEATPDAFLLDVRTAEEYQQMHIANATLIPVQVLEDNEDLLPEDKDTPIFVYCRSGNRSGQASEMLVDMGYTDVHNMEGGILAWYQAGHPVA